MESVIATREEVLHFLSTNPMLRDGDTLSVGYDSGAGDGYGASGSGSIYGNGYGVGFGNSLNCGCNYAGYGDGNGYGNGYISGEGDGDGYYNIKAFNGNIVDYIDGVPTIITQVRGNIACGYTVKDDLTLSPCYIAKAGNSFAHGNTLKEAVADAEAKEMEDMPIEERIKKFVEVFGSMDSGHTGKEFYDWHHILTGSCRMGRDEFCKAHDVDLTKKYTVRYFLEITKESYGGDIIKLIGKEYEKMEE